MKITFSVPTKKQWIRAARGDWQTSLCIHGDGPYVRNSKGAYLTNFKNYDAANIHYNTEINKYEVISMSQCMEGAIDNSTSRIILSKQIWNLQYVWQRRRASI